MPDFNLANIGGAQFRQELNEHLVAIANAEWGAEEPEYLVPGRCWWDVSGSNPVLRRRNATNSAWVIEGEMVGDTFLPAGMSPFMRSSVVVAATAAAARTALAVYSTTQVDNAIAGAAFLEGGAWTATGLSRNVTYQNTSSKWKGIAAYANYTTEFVSIRGRAGATSAVEMSFGTSRGQTDFMSTSLLVPPMWYFRISVVGNIFPTIAEAN